MEFSNKALEKMDAQKAAYNQRFANWYYGLFRENGGELVEKEFVQADGSIIRKWYPSDDFNSTMFNRGDRLSSCMDFWHWHRYERNKVLDLQKVNRCKNKTFCPNCKKLNVARFIHEFRAIMPQLQNYDFYMVTLTVPSVPMDDAGVALDDAISKFSEKFRKFNRKYSAPRLTPSGKLSSQALQSRYFDLVGGIRVLEITYSEENGFHPHLHCVLLVPKGLDEKYLEKNIEGKYSVKRRQVDRKSLIDCQIGKVWSMIWQDVDFRLWYKVMYNPAEKYLFIDGVESDKRCLEVDFVPLDDGGIYEVFKYTFKNSDVVNYRVFKNLVYALHHKRIRQGFGLLHNLKCDDFEEGELQSLDLEIEENPTDLMTYEIKSLITEFADYKKVSRFNKGDLDNVINNISD